MHLRRPRLRIEHHYRRPGDCRLYAVKRVDSITVTMSYRISSLADRHPYPTRPLRRFPRYIRLIEIVFWAGVFAVIWRTRSIFWPALAGFCASSLAWSLIYTQFRCPECRRRMTSRNEMDDNENEHLFYDCELCQITYDPQYEEGPDSFGTTSDEL